MIKGLVEAAGRELIETAESVGRFAFLVRSSVGWLLRSPIEWRQVLIQMMRIGVQSLPVTMMTTFFTGMVLALQATYQIAKFGAETYIGGIVGISMTRELGPVLTALMVSGRVGAAIAAEIGTMKVTEQIDALETLATNPVQYLVMPRVLAAAVMLPLLTCVADFVGMAGGYAISTTTLGINAAVYMEKTRQLVQVSDLLIGLLKTVVFGLIIATVGCNQGFKTTGGAEGVGKATTVSVVTSCILILLSDVFLTGLFVGGNY